MCFSDGLNLTHAERDGWEFFFSFLFFCFLGKKKTKTTDASRQRLVWRKDLFCVFSLFFTSLSSFKPEDSSTRRRGSSTNQGLRFIYFFLSSFSNSHQEDSNSILAFLHTSDISCISQTFHSYIVLFSLYFSIWLAEQTCTLVFFGVARKQVVPTYFLSQPGELFLCSTS